MTKLARGVGAEMRELVAPGRGVQLGIVLLLREVKLRDVLAVVFRRHPEDDLATEPARTHDRLVEDLWPVRRADEQDVVSGCAQDWDAQLDPRAVESDLPGKKKAV